jgi:hypothetical protein
MEHGHWEIDNHLARQEILRFMEPEGSLQWSQEPAAGPYTEPDASSP